MKIILLIACLAIGGTIAVRPKRSMGGTTIPINQAGYFVTIKRSGSQTCGGAFVSNKHIVTAAHCLYDELYKWYPDATVVSGADHKNTGGTSHEIANVVYPVEFNTITHQDDIAVVTLKAPVSWDLDRTLIALPTAEPRYGQKASLISFKTTVNPQKEAPLHTLEVEMARADRCLSNNPEYTPFYTNMFCGIVKNDEAIFRGDSGSPLVHLRKLVGVVATSRLDQFEDAFFTNVYKFVPFIRAAMEK